MRCGSDCSGLVRLADSGRRPVVVVAGNHDSPELFEALAPFLSPFGIHLVGRIKPPGEGGVLSPRHRRREPHTVACFPFLRAAQVVDFMDQTDAWYGKYADRVRRHHRVVCRPGSGRSRARGDATFLLGHFLVGGVKVDTAAPRGERDLHIGEAYAATAGGVPADLDYVALGHVHAPQPVPGRACAGGSTPGRCCHSTSGRPARRSGWCWSRPRPGSPATVRSVPIQRGRRLVRVSGPWDDIAARTDLDDAYLDLVVDTTGPEPDLHRPGPGALPRWWSRCGPTTGGRRACAAPTVRAAPGRPLRRVPPPTPTPRRLRSAPRPCSRRFEEEVADAAS